MRCLLLAVAILVAGCGQQTDGGDASGAEAALVPNDDTIDTDHDGRPVRLVAEYFGARGLDLTTANVGALDLAWPIAGPETKVLNRFGTPQLVSNRGYFHTALDVIRRDPMASDDVFAPVSGQLMIFDTYGNPRLAQQGYASIVAIYDEASRLVVMLLHVMPTPALATITAPVPIAKGALIGTLGAPLIPADKQANFHHTHVNVIDGGAMRLLDPTPLMHAYHDTVAPSVERIYLLDELGERKDALHTGRVDVIVDAFDRDDQSQRNLEVSAIAYEIRDNSGNLLRAVTRCNLADLIDSLALPYSERARSLVDFAAARAQVDGAWPKGDLGNPNRHFRYVLTHLTNANANGGRCTTLDDADGYLDVPDSVSGLDVHVTLWDPLGNVKNHTQSIARDPHSTDGPRRLVTFEIEGATTVMGENAYVLGDAPQLGMWRPRRAAKLAPVSYPTWKGTAWLPVGASVQLKFVKIAPASQDIGWGDDQIIAEPPTTWEAGSNRTFVVPAEPAPAFVHGVWQR